MLDQERIALAKEVVEVATADVEAAKARLEEARRELDSFAGRGRALGLGGRSGSSSEVKRGVVNPQDLLQTTNQFKASVAVAGRGEGDRHEGRGRAALPTGRAVQGQGRRQGRRGRPEGRRERGEAAPGAGRLPRPARALRRRDRRPQRQHLRLRPAHHRRPLGPAPAPYLSPCGAAAPIYVVDRTDIVRIFVDVPEQDANYVQIGSKATVLVKAYRDQPIPGTVTRTSWALNIKSRTLRAEIDLPNPGSQLLPGMYAYAKVIIERPGVRALPLAASCTREDHLAGRREDVLLDVRGRARETDRGARPGSATASGSRSPIASAPPSGIGGANHWTPIDGTEQVILGDLSILAEGGPVQGRSERRRRTRRKSRVQPAPEPRETLPRRPVPSLKALVPSHGSLSVLRGNPLQEGHRQAEQLLEPVDPLAEPIDSFD